MNKTKGCLIANFATVPAIFQPQDFGLALVALVALMFWKLPPWLVVLGSGAAGWLLSVAL
nr:Chromate transport protein ChrA [Escherichia coli]